MIGFIIWLTQPSTQTENETSENKESTGSSRNEENDFEPRKFEKIITTTTTSTQSDGNLKAILTSTSKYKIDTIYESSYEALTDQDQDKKISFTKSQTFEIRHEPILNRSSTPQPSSSPEFEQSVLNDSFIEDEDLRPAKSTISHFESSSESSDEKTHLPILIQPKQPTTQLPILIQQKEENVNNSSESSKLSSSLTKTLESIKKSSISGILESNKTHTSKITSSNTETEQEEMINKIVDDLVCDENEEFAYARNKQKLTMDEVEEQIRKLEQDAEMLDKHFEQIKDLKVTDFDTVSTKTVVTSSTKEKDEDASSQNSLLGLYNVKHVKAIEDHFKSLKEVSAAIKSAGLENSQLIFGIDFTISNLENGLRTFSGRSLHYCDDEIKNPYQKVIEILGKTLECFDVDGRIPAFGFGDANTKDRKVFPFSSTGYCLGFKDVLAKYNEILRDVRLSGPTNFGPLIKESIKIVKETKQVFSFSYILGIILNFI